VSERIAVVGSRQGADLEQVERFVRALHSRQPSSLLISGGAAGVDKT
jgi:predicted Rossmann fold nucleotide-binding protein DprA/Smf involved in DNA uptake